MVGAIDRELDRNHSHASQVSAERFVLHGGLVPKVNHSCCGIRLNSSGAHDYVARAPIAAGEEITFDYAMRNYSVDYFAARCRCGSHHCRGRITGWRDLPDRAQSRLRRLRRPLPHRDRRPGSHGPGRPPRPPQVTRPAAR
ncbi:hypothetical protein [Streptomyces sp. NPDC001820]|uniref:hypothetical protein n=1 Tax=Streptomyces sp. NPDC001820 TaxID=3364613 RepID=UPI00368AA680